MRSTTIRFADPVYAGLVQASHLTGLPINSIVTVACLEWLQAKASHGSLRGAPGWAGLTLRGRALELTSELRARPFGSSLDPLGGLTASAQDALAHAQEAAERGREPWVGTPHLLRGLAAVPEGRAAGALRELGVNADAVAAEAVPEEVEPAAAAGAPPPTRQLRGVVRRARDEAAREGVAQVGTDHLLLGLLLEPGSRVAEALEAAGVTERRAREVMAALPAEL
jgi:hypothetical protein